jgi:hypothetical protein
MRLATMLVLLGSLGVGLVGCGGSSLSEKDACDQAMAATCNRTFVCDGAAGLTSMGFASEAECTTAMQAENCTNLSCGTGETYHPDQAKACVDALKSQACTARDTEPTACALVCAAGGSGFGGTGGSGGGVGGGGTSGYAGVGGGGAMVGGGGAGGSVANGTGGLSAQDACKQVMSGICARTFACAGLAGLTALGYASVADCTSSEQASNCATAAQAGCSGGQTYNPTQGKACVDAVAVWSCTDLTTGTTPASCDLVCI